MTPGSDPSAPTQSQASAGATRAGWALPATLLLGALAARLAFVFLLPLQLQWRDAQELEALGRLLHERGTYGLQTLRPPGYPTLIAGIYQLLGTDLRTLRIVEALLATVAVALIGYLGVRLFGRRAGLIAMALAAFHPMLAFLPSTQYSESTSVLLMALTLVVAYGALERGNAWRWALTGALLGAQVLVRPNAIVMLPGFALGLALLLHRQQRQWLVPAAITMLAFALALAPWVVRNHTVHHRWYFVSTGGGRQLWIGNNPYATCITNQPIYVDPAMQKGLDAAGDPFGQDAFYRAEANRFMREHPLRAARLYLVKLGNIFALYPDTLTKTYVNSASRVTQGIASVVIFAGVLLGLRRWRAEPAMWPMALGSLTFVMVTALVFSSMRYRMFFETCLILIAGVGWASVWPGQPARRDAAPPAIAAR